MSTKGPPPKSTSLNKLKDVVRTAGLHLGPPEPPPVTPPVRVPPGPAEPAKDEDVFVQAMEGVHRLDWRHQPIPSTDPLPIPPDNSEGEARQMQMMMETLEGELDSAAQEHPEYIEGWIGVVGKRYLPNLRSGMYSIQGQIDLHGANRVEARLMVEDFVMRMSRFRSCCVKIIHGRGINSPEDRAVLKDYLQHWLSTRRMSRYVLAYASAPPKDGGVGAVYVLLRHA
jgi:DNA-nicking Smr family endonuclease